MTGERRETERVAAHASLITRRSSPVSLACCAVLAAACSGANERASVSDSAASDTGGAGGPPLVVQLVSLGDSLAAVALRDSLRGEGWQAFVQRGEPPNRSRWRVRAAPAPGTARHALFALRRRWTDALAIVDTSVAPDPPVRVVPVNTWTHGMTATVRWTFSADRRQLIVVEDPAAVENDAIPDAFVYASEDGDILARRGRVWDVAPAPDWRRVAYSRAYVRGAGERDSLSAAEWQAFAAAAGLEPAAARAGAFPTSGMAVAFGLCRPVVEEIGRAMPRDDEAAASALHPLSGTLGWRVRWTRDGLLALGGPPARVNDDAPPSEWTLVDPRSGDARGPADRTAFAPIIWTDGPTLDISVPLDVQSERTLTAGAVRVVSRDGWIRMVTRGADGSARRRIIGPGGALAASANGTFIVAATLDPDAKEFESPTHVVVYHIGR